MEDRWPEPHVVPVGVTLHHQGEPAALVTLPPIPEVAALTRIDEPLTCSVRSTRRTHPPTGKKVWLVSVEPFEPPGSPFTLQLEERLHLELLTIAARTGQLIISDGTDAVALPINAERFASRLQL